MKTSIITTNYNNAKYFEEYLKGIFSQSVKPDFVSIYDDGSKDNSVDIIINSLNEKSLNSKMDGDSKGAFKYECDIKGIHFIVASNGSNRGPAHGRNQAIANVEKQVDLAFVCDSDDIYYPNKISKTISVFKKYPNVGLVYSDYDVFDEKNQTTTKEFKEPFSYRRLSEECIVSNNSAFYIPLFNSVGRYDESLFGPEDYDLWLRIAEVAAVYHIPESLYKYRISGDNITITTSKERFARHVQRVHYKRNERINNGKL